MSKVFDNDVVAVRDVNLEIEDREFIVLVGPSGCGKSTILRMIAGLETVTSGEIYINDRLVNDLPPKLRDISMVFQSYALYPHMTVFNNMAFGLKMRHVPKNEIAQIVKRAAGILEIEDLLKRKPRQLSGGQRQRVALGRAIVRNPQVFLFDEPLSNLDAKLRVQMRTELKKLHARLKTTIMYVTHDQVEAMTMGSHIVVLKKGVVQQSGSPLEMYNRPANKFVAGFIGSPGMNFFPCRITEDGEELYLDTGDFRIPAPPALVKKIREHKDRMFTMGIRPEGFRVAKTQDPGETFSDSKNGWIKAHVNVVETLGKELALDLSTGDLNFTAIVVADSHYRESQTVAFDVDQDSIHLFEDKGEELAVA